MQKPGVLTTCGRSENNNNIYLNIRDLTPTLDGQYVPAKSGRGHWLFHGTFESDEADIIGLMIDEYEKKNYHIDTPDPREAIKIRMEEMQLKQVDLADVIGGKNMVSEVLNRKRKLTVERIRNLTKRLNLSPGLLIRDYKLAG